ncbi:hypothetical protein P8V03_18490, partial [Clostridium sp. A1-XYC3]
MKLSLQMIADRIMHFKPRIYLNKTDKPIIKSVKLMSREPWSVDSTAIYIAKSDYFQKGYLSENGTNLLVIGNDEEVNSFFNESSYNVIIIDAKYELESVLNEIQSIFEFYNDWEDEIQDSIINNKGLQNLIDKSYKVFSNPMFLLDSAFITLGYSREIDANDLDSLWSSVASEGHMDLAIIRSLRDTGTLEYLNTLKCATIFKHEGSKYKSIVVNIWSGT